MGFRAFHPSIILNYNHDGFAAAQCSDKHWAIDIHGSIDPWYGSPDVKELIARVTRIRRVHPNRRPDYV